MTSRLARLSMRIDVAGLARGGWQRRDVPEIAVDALGPSLLDLP